MRKSLLDVNVLLALAWPDHLHHDFAHAWFAENRHHGWATCTLTQAAFIRLSSTPQVVKSLIAPHDALRILEANTKSPEHHFWPDDVGAPGLMPAIRQRLIGHKQVTDALLLQLAIRHDGQLVTFDARLATLLPPGHPERDRIHVIPVA